MDTWSRQRGAGARRASTRLARAVAERVAEAVEDHEQEERDEREQVVHGHHTLVADVRQRARARDHGLRYTGLEGLGLSRTGGLPQHNMTSLESASASALASAACAGASPGHVRSLDGIRDTHCQSCELWRARGMRARGARGCSQAQSCAHKGILVRRGLGTTHARCAAGARAPSAAGVAQ